MKAAIAVCLLLAAVVLARPEEKKPVTYTDRFDNIDLDEVLANKKILGRYIDCCLDRDRCTPDGKELKSHIQEALETNCEKCTETQRKGTNKIIKHLINHEPTHWKDLCAKFDPTGKFTTKYEKELKNIKEA